MITCSRRYFSGSACGSSRVLMIGRLSVVSSPTSTSKKSARWLIWKPCSRPSWPIPTRPAPQTTCRVTKNGVRWRTMSANGVDRAHQVVLVRAVRRALVVGVVLVEVDRRACRASARPAATASSMTCSPALSHSTTSRGVVTSGVEYSGCAWSTYSRAPLVRMTLARPRSSSVSWLGSASCRLRSKPRASRSGDSSSKSQRARRALHRGAGVGVDDLGGGQHRVGCGLPGTEMPYSVSVPMTRRTVTGRAYAPGRIRRARCSAVDIAGARHLDQAAERSGFAVAGARRRTRRWLSRTCASRGSTRQPAPGGATTSQKRTRTRETSDPPRALVRFRLSGAHMTPRPVRGPRAMPVTWVRGTGRCWRPCRSTGPARCPACR